MRRALLLAGVLVLSCTRAELPPRTECRSGVTGKTKPTFHGDAARTGWVADQPALSPAAVARGMKLAWASEPFPATTVGGTRYIGRTYASPLYADDTRIETGPGLGTALSVAFVATSNGDVLAIAAARADCADGVVVPGTVLWSTRLGTPSVAMKLDGRDKAEPKFPGIALGTMSTPALDRTRSTLYVTAMDASASGPPQWKVFALDTATGAVRPGWPLLLDRAAIEPLNTNGSGPAFFDEDARFVSQRSALTLSQAGDRLYIAFAGYWDEAVGWLVSVDTTTPRLTATWSAAADLLLGPDGVRLRRPNGGIWAPGGPAIDDAGRVYVTTGNAPVEAKGGRNPGTWGTSLVRLSPDLALEAAFTPFDYCALDRDDIDISGSSPSLLPAIGTSSTPNLLAFGGKAGVVYLLDRDAIEPTAGRTMRPQCATRRDDAASDRSLLPEAPAEPYCDGYSLVDRCAAPAASMACVRGPLQVFGPPGDGGFVDQAKMRSTPAFFRSDVDDYLFVSGTTKTSRCNPAPAPPSLVRLRIAHAPGGPASLVRDGAAEEVTFVNPGSPVVSSNGSHDPVIWVLDINAQRSHALLDPTTRPPILYAFDGTSMKLLWRTAETDLEVGGKYGTPAIAHGTVFVATDRLRAFAPID